MKIFLVLVVNVNNLLVTTSPPCNEYEDLGFSCTENCDAKNFEDDQEDQWYQEYTTKYIQNQADRQRFKSAAQEGECGTYAEYCCHSSLITSEEKACGKRNVEGIDGIESKKSVSAKYGEWPHVCLILEKTKDNEILLRKDKRRTASLVSSNVLITGAHVFDDDLSDDNQLIVRCGDWDVQYYNETKKYEDQNVTSYKIHPDYNMSNLQNNFAVVFTSGHFIYKQHVSPICLPEVDQDLYQLENCHVSGWGKARLDAQELQRIQKSVEVSIIDHDNCQADLRTTAVGEYFILDDSFLCGRAKENYHVYIGDGGAPLVCNPPGSNSYLQIGITTGGVNNDETVLYADVTKGLCWADEVVRCNKAKDKQDVGLIGLSDRSRQLCKQQRKDKLC